MNENKFSLSARIALVIMTGGAVSGFFFGYLSEENFMILASMVFGAFFANRV